MSGWFLALREVYDAGGKTRSGDMLAKLDDITIARSKGLLMPSKRGFGPHAVEITQRGADLIEGRLALIAPYVPSDTGGRAPNSARRLVATWLMAMPRTNQVRL